MRPGRGLLLAEALPDRWGVARARPRARPPGPKWREAARSGDPPHRIAALHVPVPHYAARRAIKAFKDPWVNNPPNPTPPNRPRPPGTPSPGRVVIPTRLDSGPVPRHMLAATTPSQTCDGPRPGVAILIEGLTTKEA
ncbi:hypothetical protein GCM10010389_32200 [Streptomyces echinoruber]|uniref:Uncharacterized protein n=1 Tax=Streptomyces echinoruber TaxID=68898 RepID=A0A918VE31_9ACTN|nr:hypothetical protein GCM10010389_32200 [Streptomyces echinoruber]